MELEIAEKRIYSTNYNPSYNYHLAEQVGNITFMTQGYIPPHKLDGLYDIFESYAKTAPDNPILLLSGSNLVCAIAVHVWIQHRPNLELMQHGKILDEKKQTISSYIFHRVRQTR